MDRLPPSIGTFSNLRMVPGMYQVESYLQVRRAVMVEGMSIREASRAFGLHRDTVRKGYLPQAVGQGSTLEHPERRGGRGIPLSQPGTLS